MRDIPHNWLLSHEICAFKSVAGNIYSASPIAGYTKITRLWLSSGCKIGDQIAVNVIDGDKAIANNQTAIFIVVVCAIMDYLLIPPDANLLFVRTVRSQNKQFLAIGKLEFVVAGNLCCTRGDDGAASQEADQHQANDQEASL